MIDIDGIPIQKGQKFKIDFEGLSSDEKPTKTYNTMPIANGSSFFELDTQSIAFYDESTESWLTV